MTGKWRERVGGWLDVNDELKPRALQTAFSTERIYDTQVHEINPYLLLKIEQLSTIVSF